MAIAPETLLPAPLTDIEPTLTDGPVAVAAAVPGPMPEDTLIALPVICPVTVDPVEVVVTLTPNPIAGLDTDCVDDVEGVEVGDEVWPRPDDADGACPGA